MGFITINGSMFNSNVIGYIKTDDANHSITYRLESGRIEIETFENDIDYQNKLTEIGNL